MSFSAKEYAYLVYTVLNFFPWEPTFVNATENAEYRNTVFIFLTCSAIYFIKSSILVLWYFYDRNLQIRITNVKCHLKALLEWLVLNNIEASLLPCYDSTSLSDLSTLLLRSVIAEPCCLRHWSRLIINYKLLSIIIVSSGWRRS